MFSVFWMGYELRLLCWLPADSTKTKPCRLFNNFKQYSYVLRVQRKPVLAMTNRSPAWWKMNRRNRQTNDLVCKTNFSSGVLVGLTLTTVLMAYRGICAFDHNIELYGRTRSYFFFKSDVYEELKYAVAKSKFKTVKTISMSCMRMLPNIKHRKRMCFYRYVWLYPD